MSLAIECGGTSSTVLYYPNGCTIPKTTLTVGSANYQLMSDTNLNDFFTEISTAFKAEEIHKVGVGMPGIMNQKDKLVVTNVIKPLWPNLDRLWIGSDFETALACLDGESDIKLIVISGTGSNCFGFDGKLHAKIGGYGHVLGDRGSGYNISQKALRLALREYEHKLCFVPSVEGRIPDLRSELPPNLLLSEIMAELKMESVSQLVSWSTKAHKMEIASLASLILNSWTTSSDSSKVVQEAVESSLLELAEDCYCLMDNFKSSSTIRPEQAIEISIGLTGSIFTKNGKFAQMFQEVVQSKVMSAGGRKITMKFTILHETAQGAMNLLSSDCKLLSTSQVSQIKAALPNINNNDEVTSEEELAKAILPIYLTLPVTECRNERSMKLDSMDIGEAIDLMISEELKIYPEILRLKTSLEALIQRVSSAFKNGGRLFYVGAGTSGRLGILDASECPPTFRTSPELVQGVIAGGFSSVSRAKEGAEDSILDGMAAMDERCVCSKDVVIGIAASGRTPFVWGAMYRANNLGAFTAFLTFNPSLEMKFKPDLILSMNLGPEVLTGSTRLKSGSATKCILNMLSTLAMVQMGKCFENLMVDLNPANQKLKQRALRIVRLMTTNIANLDEQATHNLLIQNNYDIKKTVTLLRKGYPMT